MARIYTNYSEKEIELIQNTCNEYGMTPSAFQKYCVLLHLGIRTDEVDKVDINKLIEMMITSLNEKKKGDTFIVSSLLPPEIWSTLNRSQKITLSLQLKSDIEGNPSKFQVNDVLHNNVKQYIRI